MSTIREIDRKTGVARKIVVEATARLVHGVGFESFVGDIESEIGAAVEELFQDRDTSQLSETDCRDMFAVALRVCLNHLES